MEKMFVDARGVRCPLPLLKLKQALNAADVGQQVELVATDAGSWRDVPVYIASSQHELLEQHEENSEYWYLVLKGGQA